MNITQMQTAIDNYAGRLTALEQYANERVKRSIKQDGTAYKKRYCEPYTEDQKIILRTAFDDETLEGGAHSGITITKFWKRAQKIDTALHGDEPILGSSANQTRLKNLLLEFHGWSVTWRDVKEI